MEIQVRFCIQGIPGPYGGQFLPHEIVLKKMGWVEHSNVVAYIMHQLNPSRNVKMRSYAQFSEQRSMGNCDNIFVILFCNVLCFDEYVIVGNCNHADWCGSIWKGRCYHCHCVSFGRHHCMWRVSVVNSNCWPYWCHQTPSGHTILCILDADAAVSIFA